MTYTEPYGDETGEGWKTIIADTHKRLHHLDPGYTILQIKEKFGGLRYYFQPSKNSDPLTWEIMQDVVIAAELRCDRACEYCGAPGKPRAGSWIKTLCDDCAERVKDLAERVNNLAERVNNLAETVPQPVSDKITTRRHDEVT